MAEELAGESVEHPNTLGKLGVGKSESPGQNLQFGLGFRDCESGPGTCPVTDTAKPDGDGECVDRAAGSIVIVDLVSGLEASAGIEPAYEVLQTSA